MLNFNNITAIFIVLLITLIGYITWAGFPIIRLVF